MTQYYRYTSSSIEYVNHFFLGGGGVLKCYMESKAFAGNYFQPCINTHLVPERVFVAAALGLTPNMKGHVSQCNILLGYISNNHLTTRCATDVFFSRIFFFFF